MKHYVISLMTATCTFDYKCISINEAYNAVLELSVAYGIRVKRDEVMETLVHMKEGDLLSYKSADIMIIARDGEV